MFLAFFGGFLTLVKFDILNQAYLFVLSTVPLLGVREGADHEPLGGTSPQDAVGAEAGDQWLAPPLVQKGVVVVVVFSVVVQKYGDIFTKAS